MKARRVAKSRQMTGGGRHWLALGCSLARWAAVSRLGSPQSAIGCKFDLVLPNFRNLAVRKPVGNRRRLNADRSSDFGLASKVFKKVIRGHAASISHALRFAQEKLSLAIHHLATCSGCHTIHSHAQFFHHHGTVCRMRWFLLSLREHLAAARRIRPMALMPCSSYMSFRSFHNISL